MAVTSSLRRIRNAAWIAVAICLTAGGIYFLTTNAPELQKAIGGAARIGGPFSLTAQNGKTFTDKDLLGKPYAVFFGYTHCPDVCPTTMLEMSHRLQELGGAADKMRVLFVTVDPQRDTAEFLRDYLKAFDERIIGLTGTPEQIATIAKGYRVIYEKVAGEGDGYTMNHTATIYLFDAKGAFAGTIAYQEAEKSQLAKLKRLVGAS